MNTINLRLRELRRSQNMSQEELAQKLGISRQAIIALEQGDSLPSLPVIMAILRVLGITFKDLFEDSWQPFRQVDLQNEANTAQLAQYRHSEGALQIPVALTESTTCLTVVAELAGIKEEDLTVDLGTQHILIMAIKKPLPGTENATINELTTGPIMRILSLPQPIDVNKAQASFDHGILTLTLPKSMPESQRRITFKNLPKPKETSQSHDFEVKEE